MERVSRGRVRRVQVQPQRRAAVSRQMCVFCNRLLQQTLADVQVAHCKAPQQHAPRCRTPHLDLLARHDADHHTDHLATLGAYLDSFGDVSSAAARLDVHSNTLRYRLKRIDEIIGLDLADPVARFVLELQWRLR
jgi:DNA-binding PucR family transcriptional regulator